MAAVGQHLPSEGGCSAPNSDLARFLAILADLTDGWAVAVDVLAMRLLSRMGDTADLEPLLNLGRSLLSRIEPASNAHQRLDHDLSTLALTSLIGAPGEAAAVELCRILATNFATQILSFHEFHSLVGALFKAQPFAALDAFSIPAVSYGWRYPTILSMFDGLSAYHAHPLKNIPDDVILEWCARKPVSNYVVAATGVPYCHTDPNGTLAWTNLATKLLERAPDPITVLTRFIARFEPRSWSGSRAAIVEANAELLVQIETIHSVLVLRSSPNGSVSG